MKRTKRRLFWILPFLATLVSSCSGSSNHNIQLLPFSSDSIPFDYSSYFAAPSYTFVRRIKNPDQFSRDIEKNGISDVDLNQYGADYFGHSMILSVRFDHTNRYSTTKLEKIHLDRSSKSIIFTFHSQYSIANVEICYTDCPVFYQTFFYVSVRNEIAAEYTNYGKIHIVDDEQSCYCV